jgi:DNA-binding response OmpR family regulator
VDQERLVPLEEEKLRIGFGYIKFGGSTVHLTAKECTILCAIFDARPLGITTAEIGTQISAGNSINLSSLVSSHIHTTKKKLASLSNGRVAITWNRKTKAYCLSVF